MEDEVKIKDLTARLSESSKSSKGDIISDGEKTCETCELGEESRPLTDSVDLTDGKGELEIRKVTDREAKLIGK